MLHIGIVGFVFMGRTHYRCWRELPDAKVTAICETDPKTLQDSNLKGNIDSQAERIDLSGTAIYTNLQEMLQNEKLDAVSIALPTYLHAEVTEKVLLAGVNVLCEKPMALNAKDCERMIDAAKKSGRFLMIAHCLRFWPEWAWLKEVIEKGEYGALNALSIERMGAAPGWSGDNWFCDESRSGGMTLDLHIHDADFVQYILGMPRAVFSCGSYLGGGVNYIQTQYLYENGPVVTATGSWMMMPAYGFRMAYLACFEKATVVYDLTQKPVLKVYPAKGEMFSPSVGTKDGYSREVEYFMRRISGEKGPEVISNEQSRNSVVLVEAEKKSIREGIIQEIQI